MRCSMMMLRGASLVRAAGGLVVFALATGVAIPVVQADEVTDDFEVPVPVEPPPPAPPLPPPAAESRGRHEYTWALRAGTWVATVAGNYGPVTDSNASWDDFEAGWTVDTELRLKKHDLRIYYRGYTNDGDVSVSGTKIANTRFDVDTIEFLYDYSFWTIEKSGFRFGPGIGLGLIIPDIKVTETVTSAALRAKFDTPIPAPTLRLAGEVVIWGDFLFRGSSGVFYLPPVGSRDLEGWFFEMDTAIGYRPFDHVGFYAGMNWIHVDAQDKKDLDLDLDVWGPTVGVEVKF